MERLFISLFVVACALHSVVQATFCRTKMNGAETEEYVLIDKNLPDVDFYEYIVSPQFCHGDKRVVGVKATACDEKHTPGEKIDDLSDVKVYRRNPSGGTLRVTVYCQKIYPPADMDTMQNVPAMDVWNNQKMRTINKGSAMHYWSD